MFPGEFIEHLTGKGLLLDGAVSAAITARSGVTGAVDWLSVTKLNQSTFADELASFYGCPRLLRSDLARGTFAGKDMSVQFLRERRLFPFEDPSGRLTVAIAAPTEAETIRAVELALLRPVTLAAATSDDIEAVLATALDTERPNVAAAPDVTIADDNLDDLRDLARGAPVVRAVDEMLRTAVEQRATDLHIEPFADGLQIRLRVDGLLRAISAPPSSMAKGLLSRLKIMAGLNITERRMPQDGRARIVVGGTEIDLRIATMPTMHGESAVVRLLRKGGGVVALSKLGLSARDATILQRSLQAPFGMIIVTGPTGSGKTTTLAASLSEINEPTRKILTIEDPVEYQISGINQTQIHPSIGLTFAAALRSFLRQDPDVIMVGEMRDAETAHIGVHAALTGHLVLTTLHTNTAAGAITRLIDMNVESFLLASCVRAIIGQRLARILCDNCKVPRCLTAEDIAREEKYTMLNFVAGDIVHTAKGCEWCGFSGFRGRQGVFEVLEVTPAIRRAIGPKTDATELEEIARRQGMITMTEDGVGKCRAGLTTVDEIFRVAVSL